MNNEKIVVIRGAGDIASGTINRLHKCGFKLICLESNNPSAIRRTVSYCQCIYDNKTTIDGVTAVKTANKKEDIISCWQKNFVPVIIDEHCDILNIFNPFALIDAIIAKKNLGTKKDMADITIALGPGFEAGKDVDYVIETMRGYNLGKIITNGFTISNTGVPGMVGGESALRVIHAPQDGKLKIIKDITSIVKKGDTIALIDDMEVKATIDGLIRGMINDGYIAKKGLKIIDIDPRINEKENCFLISDKARCISGSVLEIIISNLNKY